MKRGILSALLLTFTFILLSYPRTAGMGELVSLRDMDLPPSLLHPFGTDGLGRDLLARVQDAILETVFPLWGLTIAALSAGMALAGVMAPYQRLGTGLERALLPVTIVPLFITVFFLAALFEKTGFWTVAFPLMALCFARAFLAFTNLLRESAKLGYWQAHALMGGGTRQRFFRYGVLGDWREESARTVFFHLQVILAAETALSYLGFGIAEPQASLGGLLAAAYPSILKGNVTFALILIAIFTVLSLLPSSMDALLRKKFRARRSVPTTRPFPDTASRPIVAVPRDQSEDPSWENA